MASRHVMHAAVVSPRIVKTDPTRQVRHWLGAGPIGIVLVPRDHAAVMRGLAKKLIVPKAHRATEQLRCRHHESRIPQQVMKPRANTPRSERVNHTRQR